LETVTFSQLGWEAWLTIGVTLSVLLSLALTRLPADIVVLAGLGLLMITGVIGANVGLSGFASSGMITVGLLYVVAAGIQETGGLSWITNHVLGSPKGVRMAQLRLLAPVVSLSAFLNNTPVVAMFIPVVGEWCRKLRISPSRLLIPLSYAAIFGGICTLIGTSTNLVVNTMIQKHFVSDPVLSQGLSMFEITKIGIPCALLGMAYLIIFGKYLLPDRKPFEKVLDNPREYTLELEVLPKSNLVGNSIEKSGLRKLPGAFLAELVRGDQVYSAVSPDQIIMGGDRLLFVGNIESMRPLFDQKGLQPAPNQLFKLESPRHERCLVEAVVSHTCPMVGKTIKEGRFRNVYNAVVIAVARGGERLSGKLGDIRLQAGDMLLIESHEGFVPRQKDSRDFYLVSNVENSTPRQLNKAPIAVAILVAMVVSAAFDWLSMLNASLLAAAAVLVLRCCTITQARRSMEWDVLVVIGAALGIGLALEETGAAAAIAGALLGLVGDNPLFALGMVALVTTVFTEVITNNAAAALVFPIAMNTAERLDVSPMPFIMCIMIGASASFATPIGYQTNLMVYGPGGYRFSDYLRVGVPLNLLIGIVSVSLTPLIWPF
jgi:di/tricarboxylate transporter